MNARGDQQHQLDVVSVYTWGRGEDGQLGLGDTNDQHSPELVEALKGKVVQPVACGSGHTVVLSDGEVYTWGRGDDGRLGHGDNGWKYVPRPVEALRGKTIRQVTCGSYHTAAVTDTGILYTWGGGMYGKLGHGNESGHSTPCMVDALSHLRVEEIACGSRHTVVLVADPPAVYAWGDKENGVSGHGDTEGHQYLPLAVDTLSGKQVKQISACGFHSAALTDRGEVYTWGEGKFGRLGHGGERNQTAPRRIEALTRRVGMGGEVTEDGMEEGGWGESGRGWTGAGGGEIGKVVQVSCGGFHIAAITDTGVMLTWGGGEHGQLGHGDKLNKSVPCVVQALQGQVLVTQISCGWSHTVALSEKGEVRTWGNGDHGKLGHGDTQKVTLPKLVEALADMLVVRVASYNEHTAVLVDPHGASRHGRKTISSLHADLSRLMECTDFSDICFLVEDTHIHSHKAFLAVRCEHFRAMFSSGMRECQDGVVEIRDIRLPVFRALLTYIYTDIADISPELAVELYVVADLYTMDRLKSLCETVVYKGITVTNSSLLLRLADELCASRLKEIAMCFIVGHFDAVSKSDGFGGLSRELILETLQNR